MDDRDLPNDESGFKTRNFCLLQNLPGCRNHPVTYPKLTVESFLDMKLQGPEADRSPSSSAEADNEWSHSSILPYTVMAWWLIKHKKELSFFT
jgi:hypothetical protein